MPLAEIVPPNGVMLHDGAASKRAALELIAEAAAPLTAQHAQALLHGLIERERLGSTAAGHGCAIPHARLAGLGRAVGVFLRLAEPVEFEAPDRQPVDLLFGLFTDAGAGADHLLALSAAAALLREPEQRKALRAAPDAAALRAVILAHRAKDAA